MLVGENQVLFLTKMLFDLYQWLSYIQLFLNEIKNFPSVGEVI